MPIVLCRVDDRLMHGQVVIGWGRPLGVDVHRAGGRRACREPVGAGPLPDGGAARASRSASPRWRRPRRSSARGRPASGAASSSPATSRRWPPFTGRARGDAADQPRRDPSPAGSRASGCRTCISPTKSSACLVALEAGGAEITAQDLPDVARRGAQDARVTTFAPHSSSCSSSGARSSRSTW